MVVHAPTGAGKTYVFELLYSTLKGQAVFTVPTRALANDKYAEWRAAGWDVGICTGDVNLRPDARVIVATLETQRGRLLRQRGPQPARHRRIPDARRRPPGRQLRTRPRPRPARHPTPAPERQRGQSRRRGRVAAPASGATPNSSSTRNAPCRWRKAFSTPCPTSSTRARFGYWPRLLAKALLADLGPILVFAPRRAAAEELARDLAGALPVDDPLALSPEQAALAGEKLAKLLRKPHRLPPQRPELRRARGVDRTPRQDRPAPRGRRHDGPRGRGEFLHAFGARDRHALLRAALRAPPAAGGTAPDVRPRGPPGVGRQRVRAGRAGPAAAGGRASEEPQARHADRLAEPALRDGSRARTRRAAPRRRRRALPPAVQRAGRAAGRGTLRGRRPAAVRAVGGRRTRPARAASQRGNPRLDRRMGTLRRGGPKVPLAELWVDMESGCRL